MRDIVAYSVVLLAPLALGIASSNYYKVEPQTLTVAIPPNTPFNVEFEHNGGAAGYRMWCDGAIVKNYSMTEINAGKSTTLNSDGNYTFKVLAPGLTAGQHSCLMSAIYAEGDQKSEPITIPIGNFPMRPLNFKVIVK